MDLIKTLVMLGLSGALVLCFMGLVVLAIVASALIRRVARLCYPKRLDQVTTIWCTRAEPAGQECCQTPSPTAWSSHSSAVLKRVE